MATGEKDALEKHGTTRFSSLEDLCRDHYHMLRSGQRGTFTEIPNGKYTVELAGGILLHEFPRVACLGGTSLKVFFALRSKRGKVRYFEDAFYTGQIRVASEILSAIRGRTVTVRKNQFVDEWIQNLLRGTDREIKEYAAPDPKTS